MKAVTVQSLLDAMQAANVPYVVELALFDVYRGKGVEQGKKSLAFRVLLQDTQKTLTDSEIEPKHCASSCCFAASKARSCACKRGENDNNINQSRTGRFAV